MGYYQKKDFRTGALLGGGTGAAIGALSNIIKNRKLKNKKEKKKRLLRATLIGAGMGGIGGGLSYRKGKDVYIKRLKKRYGGSFGATRKALKEFKKDDGKLNRKGTKNPNDIFGHTVSGFIPHRHMMIYKDEYKPEIGVLKGLKERIKMRIMTGGIGRITSPRNTFLHEYGHHEDFKKNKENMINRNKYDSEIKANEFAKKLLTPKEIKNYERQSKPNLKTYE